MCYAKYFGIYEKVAADSGLLIKLFDKLTFL